MVMLSGNQECPVAEYGAIISTTVAAKTAEDCSALLRPRWCAIAQYTKRGEGNYLSHKHNNRVFDDILNAVKERLLTLTLAS
jgi:hypothetical protein